MQVKIFIGTQTGRKRKLRPAHCILVRGVTLRAVARVGPSPATAVDAPEAAAGALGTVSEAAAGALEAAAGFGHIAGLSPHEKELQDAA